MENIQSGHILEGSGTFIYLNRALTLKFMVLFTAEPGSSPLFS